MTDEKWYYILNQARKINRSFVRCDGKIYQVYSTSYATGPSPLWSVEEVIPADIPPFVSDLNWYG